MSDQPFGPSTTSQNTRDVAVEESKTVGHDVAQSAKSVAQTAGAQTQQVVGEAKNQAVSLLQQVRQDVTNQAGSQQQRAAGGLRTLAGELQQMAEGPSESGMATGLARQAAERVESVAGWLENREPTDLLEEVRRYARRSPGTFLAVCALAGLVGGRLTRGLRDEAQQEQELNRMREQAALVPTYGESTTTYGESTTYGGTTTYDGGSYDEGSGYGGRPGVAGVSTGGLATGAGVSGGDPLAGVGTEEAWPQGQGYPATGDFPDTVVAPGGSVPGSEAVETHTDPFDQGDRR